MISKGLNTNSNYTIMLVDDEPQQLRYLRLILKDAGYNVINVDSAKTALKILNTTLPDVILSDLVMPEIDGIELCKKIYSNENLKHIPFVMITAIQDSLYQKQGLAAGALDYIYKPFTPDILLGKIHQILTRTLEKKRIEVLFLCREPERLLAEKQTFDLLGINIKVMDNIEHARELIHTQSVNMVLSEIELKGKNGFEFCGLIKNSVFKTLPFIILSNNISNNVFLEGSKFGVNDYWDSSLTAKEIASNIKIFFNYTQPSSSYPKGISGSLNDSSVIEIAQMLSVSKKSGILALSNHKNAGHLHFNNGQITDAFCLTYKGAEAFYSLSMMDNKDGKYHFIATQNGSEKLITETTERLFLYAARLKDEICSIYNEKILVNKTISADQTENEKSFIKNATGEKSLKLISLDMNADLYHVYLIFEKLVNKGCIISPVKEVPLLEPV
ncbi:MAG: response regulator [Calditrichaeota bacterium]|nr:response regulator [Calditrichota bacterium]